MPTYDVGQIIYIVSSKNMQVLPFIVAEEVVRKTLQGQEVTYLVKRDKTNKTYRLSELSGEIYEDLESVREALLENTRRAVNKICDATRQKVALLENSATFENQASQAPEKHSSKIPTDDELKSFILEDGTKVRVNLGDI